MIKNFLAVMGLCFIIFIVMLIIINIYDSIKNKIRNNKVKKQKEQDIVINEVKRFTYGYMKRLHNLESRVSTDKVIDDFILMAARIMAERERKGMSISEFNEKTDKYKKQLTEEFTKDYERINNISSS